MELIYSPQNLSLFVPHVLRAQGLLILPPTPILSSDSPSEFPFYSLFFPKTGTQPPWYQIPGLYRSSIWLKTSIWQSQIPLFECFCPEFFPLFAPSTDFVLQRVTEKLLPPLQ